MVIATILREQGNTGVETHIRQLRRYLLEKGTQVSVITPLSRNRVFAAAVFSVRLLLGPLSGSASVAWYRHWHGLFLRRALRRELADGKPCIVYAHDPMAALAALRARQGPQQCVVLAVHFRISQADEWVGKGKIKEDGTVYRGIRRFEQTVIPKVDGLVYVSEWAQSALCDWLPKAADVKSAVIGNFVTPWPTDTPRALAGDLVTTGHLEPVKNHRYQLEVLAAAAVLGRRLTLDVFGGGPLLGELQAQALQLGVAEQVRFRGFQRNVRDFLPGYRIYVHSSYSESSSLAIMEAMAAGLPIVAAGIGPIPELCDEGVEARFWPLDDPAKGAATLLALLDDETAYASAASAANARFHRDYNADVVVPRLLSFLRDTAPASTRSGS
jgi:glycosyltransferase involved in cell wall biosynthesis